MLILWQVTHAEIYTFFFFPIILMLIQAITKHNGNASLLKSYFTAKTCTITAGRIKVTSSLIIWTWCKWYHPRLNVKHSKNESFKLHSNKSICVTRLSIPPCKCTCEIPNSIVLKGFSTRKLLYLGKQKADPPQSNGAQLQHLRWNFVGWTDCTIDERKSCQLISVMRM